MRGGFDCLSLCWCLIVSSWARLSLSFDKCLQAITLPIPKLCCVADFMHLRLCWLLFDLLTVNILPAVNLCAVEIFCFLFGGGGCPHPLFTDLIMAILRACPSPSCGVIFWGSPRFPFGTIHFSVFRCSLGAFLGRMLLICGIVDYSVYSLVVGLTGWLGTKRLFHWTELVQSFLGQPSSLFTDRILILPAWGVFCLVCAGTWSPVMADSVIPPDSPTEREARNQCKLTKKLAVMPTGKQ